MLTADQRAELAEFQANIAANLEAILDRELADDSTAEGERDQGGSVNEGAEQASRQMRSVAHPGSFDSFDELRNRFTDRLTNRGGAHAFQRSVPHPRRSTGSRTGVGHPRSAKSGLHLPNRAMLGPDRAGDPDYIGTLIGVGHPVVDLRALIQKLGTQWTSPRLVDTQKKGG